MLERNDNSKKLERIDMKAGRSDAIWENEVNAFASTSGSTTM